MREHPAGRCQYSDRTRTLNRAPTYYEIALKIKYASGNRDAQMVDIVYDSIYVDFTNIASIPTVIDMLLLNNKTNFASEYGSQESSINALIESMTEKFKTVK